MYGSYALVNGFGKTGIDNAAHVGGLLAGLTMAWFIGTPLRLKKGATGRLTGRIAAGTCLVLLCAGVTVAAAPKLSNDYKVHVEIVELLKELGDKEKGFAQEAKKMVSMGEENTPANAVHMFRHWESTYEEYMEKLARLKPKAEDVKRRQEVLLDYVKLKKQGGALMAEPLAKDDPELADAGSRKVVQANKLAAELAKPVKWYR